MSGQSEGAIIDVYENYVDVRAITFKDAEDTIYNTKYLPIGQYRLYTAPEGDSGSDSDGYVYVTSSMVSVNSQKASGVTFECDDNTHTLSITFTAVSQGILITDGNIASDSNVTVLFDSIKFTDSAAESTGRIGFYDETGSYNLTSGLTAHTSDYSAIQVNTSSSYVNKGGSVPVTMVITNLHFKIN